MLLNLLVLSTMLATADAAAQPAPSVIVVNHRADNERLMTAEHLAEHVAVTEIENRLVLREVNDAALGDAAVACAQHRADYMLDAHASSVDRTFSGRGPRTPQMSISLRNCASNGVASAFAYGAAPTLDDSFSKMEAYLQVARKATESIMSHASAVASSPRLAATVETLDGGTSDATCAKPNVDAHVVSGQHPVRPPIAVQQGIAGDVVLRVRLDANSHVAPGTTVVKSPSAVLNATAMRAAQESMYQTAIVNCVPTPSDVRVVVTFTDREGAVRIVPDLSTPSDRR